MNEYELVIAAHLVVPEDINVSWRDIAGLDSVVQELKESVVLPVKHREMFKTSTLYQAPKVISEFHGCFTFNNVPFNNKTKWNSLECNVKKLWNTLKCKT